MRRSGRGWGVVGERAGAVVGEGGEKRGEVPKRLKRRKRKWVLIPGRPY